MLSLLRDRHPGLRAHITQMPPETAIPALHARDFDLVVAEEYPGNPNPRPPGLEQEDLLDDPLHLALPAPAGGRSDTGPGPKGGPTASLRSLAGHPWAMEPEGTAARHWAMTLCRNAGFEPDVRFETTDLLIHLRLVEQGHAAALLPSLVWNGAPPTVALRQLPRGWRTRRVFTAVRRGRTRHPAIMACRHALRQAAADGGHLGRRVKRKSSAPDRGRSGADDEYAQAQRPLVVNALGVLRATVAVVVVVLADPELLLLAALGRIHDQVELLPVLDLVGDGPVRAPIKVLCAPGECEGC